MTPIQTLFRKSRLGLGMAALGRPGYINLGHATDLGPDRSIEAMQAHAHEVLDLAWKKGIRYYDAARSYGEGERFLGNWLRKRGIAPGEVVVGSKWGYTYTANWQIEAEQHEVKEHSLTVLNRQWRESQDMVGAYLDLYQIHSATLESGVLANKEVLKRLLQFKRRGIYIGLSLSGANQPVVLERALAVQVDGRALFDSVQATYNLLETSAGPMLKQAHEAGLGIIIKEALANGRLTSRNEEPAFAEKLTSLQTLAQQQQTSIDALALAGVLANDWADMVLSGAAQADHLLSNLSALELNWNDEQEAQVAGLAEAPEVYWQRRKSLVWN